MPDGRRLRRAAISASAAVSACVALALPAQAAPAQPAGHGSGPVRVAAPQTAAAQPSIASPRPPKHLSGRTLQGDIVPGRTPAGGLHQHASGTTKVTKVLVILGYWDKHDSTTPAHAKDVVITQANTWYRRASYGHQGLTGTATKWLKIPRQTCGALNDNVIKAARKAADKAHYHSADYDRFVLYEPCSTNGGAIGIGNLPGNQVLLVKGGLTLATAVHEQGHNYGLGHANELICKKGSSRATYQPGTSCQTVVYDDFSSDMSSQWNGKYAADFTAPQKNALGWLSGHVTTVSGAGSVTLSPYESTSGTHAIKIPGSQGRTYWVEYRTATGNDAHLPAAYRGVLLHLSRPDTNSANKAARLSQSLLLHTLAPDPGVLGFQSNADPAYLPPTSSWTTPDGIKITLTSETSGAAHITISRNAHVHAPSQVGSPSATALDTSATVSFHRATDGGTPIRNYTITANSSNGGTQRTATLSDLTSHTTLHATVTGLTNDKSYTFSIRANSESGNQTSPDTGPVTPTLLPPSVQITSPTGGDVHDVVSVNATGTPNPLTHAAITGLDLIVDGILVDSANTAHAILTWDTGNAPGFAQNAAHTIKVEATDANNRDGMATVAVNLTQSTGPTLTLDELAQAVQAFHVDINGTLHPHGAGSSHDLDFLAIRIGDNEDDFSSPTVGDFTDNWDTTSLSGSQTIKITAIDQGGRVSVITTTVPVNKPDVQFTNPGSSTVFGNVHFTGTVKNNSPVDGLSLDVLRAGVTVDSFALDVDSGQSAPYDVVVNVDELPAVSAAFTVSVTDGTTRNTTPTAHTLNVTRKNPDLTVTAPANNILIHDTVHFTGTAKNNSGTDGLNLVVKQGTTTVASSTLNIAPNVSGSFDITGSVAGLTDTTLASFTVNLTDNKSTPGFTQATRTWTVSHLPEITLTTPIVDHQVFGAAHFTGTLTNHSKTSGLTVAISTPGGTITPASQSVAVPLRSSASFDIKVDVDGVPAGAEQIFTITVTDPDGLVQTLTRQLEVTHPNPERTVTAPVANAIVHGSTHFTGSATNNSGTDGLTLDIEVNGDPFATASLPIAAGATGSFDVTKDVSPLDIGSDVFVLTVTDANSLTSDGDSRQLGVDHPPVVTVTAPVADDEVSGIVTVTGTVSNGAPDAGNPTVSAVVDDDHQGTDTPTVAPGATGNFSIDLDLSDLTGDWTIQVSATDASGITTTTPVAGVDVTIVAPAEVSVSTPVDGDPAITSGSVDFEGMATNHAGDAQVMTVHITEPSHTVDQTFDVDPAVGPDSSGGWTRDVAVDGLSNGLHTFTVTASYPFGGTSAPVTVTVDIENP